MLHSTQNHAKTGSGLNSEPVRTDVGSSASITHYRVVHVRVNTAEGVDKAMRGRLLAGVQIAGAKIGSTGIAASMRLRSSSRPAPVIPDTSTNYDFRSNRAACSASMIDFG